MYSMVMLAELPKGRLVSFSTSILTSASVTTLSERENSGGVSFEKLKEIATMATIPTPTYFKFVFLTEYQTCRFRRSTQP
ncbi:bacteriophage protein [Xenorhabdus miraniensis]|uniref:Bacteriophage protein n=2 Tax=Xenorhabdus miraniensis TaxID=351674 RepID=A0A2D0JS78_9GAMM|nr:bacteriophage protein [Xenorhabdus miraniensis]